VLTDAVVRDTEGRASDSRFGWGMAAQDAARIEASRLLLAGNRDAGLLAAEAGTVVVLTDAVVRDTRGQAGDASDGRGIQVQEGARLEASRLLVARNHNVGLACAGAGVEVALTDVAVRDTLPEESSLAYGYGVEVSRAAHLSGERVLVHGVHELGLWAALDGSAELRDVSIASVGRSECDCPDRGFGHAVASIAGAVRLTRFEIRDAATCGLFVAQLPGALEPSSLDVETGIVARAAIGACVQIDGYELSRLMRGVVYADNGVNLDSTMLPVPMPSEVVAP
jgi:hypothetical protein